MKHYEDSEIYNYSFTTLVGSIQDIIKDDNPVKDLVSLPQAKGLLS